ncbi:MAG: WD40/YVTN/BNR-like repeat-containing protein [Thermoanaerobaculia bacterium]
MFKTGDGGMTWAAIGAGLALSDQISSIVIDSRDRDVVYVSGDCGPYLEPLFEGSGVFRSDDGGLTFEPAMNGLSGLQRCTNGLSLDPVHPDTVYATLQYARYARSDDGARTWSNAATALPDRSVADPHDPLKRYGSAGGLFVTSTDGGLTWTRQQTTVLDVDALAIDDATSRLFLAGQYGVYRSDDGGRSVLALNGTARERTNAIVYDEATGVLVIGTETGVYRSEAFPWDDWKRLPTGDSSMRMRDVAPSHLEAATMYAVSTRQVHVTRNHGVSWSVLGDSLPLTNLQAPTLESIAVDVADNVYVVGSLDSGNTLYKLSAGTRQWIQLEPPIGGSFGRAFADPGTAGVIYLTRGNTPALMATRDGGATWNFHFTPPGGASSLAIDPRNGAVFYTATDTGLFKSLDGGHTWSVLLPQRMILDVQLSPADPETIYAREREYGTPKDRIHVSRDGGATWTSHAGPGEIVSMAPDRLSPRTIYVSVRDPLDEGTVFRSTSEGGNWTPIAGNLPKDYTRLALSPDGTVLHATTLTGGMWELFLTKSRQRAVAPR